MYFSAEIQGKHYRVELWKGQYGKLLNLSASTGCEVGVYYQTYDDEHPTYKTNEFWKVDAVGHLFEIFLKLYYNDDGHAGKHIFSRGAQLTWWLNGFKPFLSVLPTDLYMEAIIDFNNPVVGDIFYDKNKNTNSKNPWRIYPVDMIQYNDRYLIQWWG